MLTIEGNIVSMDKIFRGRIEIDQSGMINKIGEPTGDADFIFKDELVFPGFIDLHVHAREDVIHTQDYKEDFKTAGEAAINGGVVAFADMPNNPTPPIDDASYVAKNSLVQKSPVPVLLYAGIGPDTKPLSKKVPYKVFMGKSIGELFFSSLRGLETALAKYEGQNISFHCEDPNILEDNKNQSTHALRRPKEAEISAVDFALRLIKKYNLIGKICHCSAILALEKIIDAKKHGANVTVEVAPHHLYFDKEPNKSLLQVNPPIRQSKKNRLALIEALRRGEIDFLATDHAPHTIEEKENGISGLPQLDTFGPFTTWLVKEHNFSPKEIARVCSQNPGNFFNQFSAQRYGQLKEGYVGSLTILDMNRSISVTKEMLKTKCEWSPFEGVSFPGRVVMTVVKGKVYEK
ncbi:amidohydrolase [Candidatus Nomurabacteria bacterium RIFCSPHIGHO2_02_FULL_41_18]|uniref:Amidohydrolase n=1 Tax=Candidatus Nomurabacteria bacterium RIFCSPHIGHO2_02_FULL_41_18 TaxID=1801754 RepID=A0A1F6W578_9BACT|nr:MAG: amidohydrolase [Candidatus Nomurabacteria bacterium RIFCSPHIGHO2_01_FULL_41_71]OGI76962.1 MAG: amidohydrolase [Candidatus Nomurabacteria bacterium RIFCSPHIGHO2_02_FULL_41_18]OGI89472.1 MAG: amidohydrolase [Candidatus Nomurabacteria bacterium RIFCSPLOWO2_01_FULL_41_52b]OGJ00498.1 MAG: amidohydrolase [Candidatus Nomurabacteria bacterium RIFCSPLOWO2_02_FULL_41_9]